MNCDLCGRDPRFSPSLCETCLDTVRRLAMIRDWHLTKYQEGDGAEPLRPSRTRLLPEGVAADEIDDTRWHVETVEERRKRLEKSSWGKTWY